MLMVEGRSSRLSSIGLVRPRCPQLRPCSGLPYNGSRGALHLSNTPTPPSPEIPPRPPSMPPPPLAEIVRGAEGPCPGRERSNPFPFPLKPYNSFQGKILRPAELL